jgi:phenylacetic acid degradation operon negative regulatory protein
MVCGLTGEARRRHDDRVSPYSYDSRLVLLMLAGAGVEATGVMLMDAWRRASRRGRLDRELRKLEGKGLVDRVGGGDLDARVFRLTAAGRQALVDSANPEKQWSRDWDGKWRLVIFDVPQAHTAMRTRLRRKLRELHFGWLQNSVWLTPDRVSRLIRQFGRERGSVESLAFLEGRPVGGETDSELVAGSWDFAKLARLHASYLQVVQLRPARERRSQAQAWTAWLQMEQRAWAEIVRVDPLLPEPLWPGGYAGRVAWNARVEALRAAGEAVVRLGVKA